jgi:hypothetical protein
MSVKSALDCIDKLFLYYENQENIKEDQIDFLFAIKKDLLDTKENSLKQSNLLNFIKQ